MFSRYIVGFEFQHNLRTNLGLIRRQLFNTLSQSCPLNYVLCSNKLQYNATLETVSRCAWRYCVDFFLLYWIWRENDGSSVETIRKIITYNVNISRSLKIFLKKYFFIRNIKVHSRNRHIMFVMHVKIKTYYTKQLFSR